MTRCVEYEDKSSLGTKNQFTMPKAKRTGVVGSHYTTVVLPPCKVCAAEATGYHFGVITCEACKAFYRRSLLRNRPAKCKRNGSCDTDGSKINSCSACRFRKCCDLGMSPEGIRRGRFSLPLRTTTILEANLLEAKQDSSSESATSSPGPLDMSIDSLSSDNEEWVQHDDPDDYITDIILRTEDQMSMDAGFGLVKRSEMMYLIDGVVSSQDAVYPSLRKYFTQPLGEIQKKVSDEFTLKGEIYERVFGSSKDISAEEYQQVFANTGEDLDERLLQLNMYGEQMEDSIAKYIHFCDLLPGFNTFGHVDKSKLIKAAHLEFWFFGSHMLFNKKLGVAISFDGTQNGTKEHMTRFFDKDWIDLNFEFSDNLTKLHLTFEEIALLRAIVLTAADRCPLEENSKIHSLQERFFECLRFTLAKTSPHPTKRLCKILSRLMYCRSLNEINTRVNKQFLDQWGFIVHDYPLWKDMLTNTDCV